MPDFVKGFGHIQKSRFTSTEELQSKDVYISFKHFAEDKETNWSITFNQVFTFFFVNWNALLFFWSSGYSQSSKKKMQTKLVKVPQ